MSSESIATGVSRLDSTLSREGDDEEALAYHQIDRYGFVLIDSSFFHKHKEMDDEEMMTKRKDVETSREMKWLKMLKRWDFTQKYRAIKLQRRIRKGIPDAFRGVMWYRILEMSAYTTEDKKQKKTLRTMYPNLYDISKVRIDKIPNQTLDEIERDVDRTFPNHVFFRVVGGPGQESLRRVLRWYASIDSEVGYCQGMGFVAGLLLTYMPEDTAFYCFGGLMQHAKGPLRDLYLPGLVDTKKKLFVFGALINQFIPKLGAHFQECGVVPTMYATEWILTVFCRGFSFDLVTRVIDDYCLEGFKVVYRVSLALLKNVEQDLLKQTFEGILASMRNIPSMTDAEELMQAAWNIPLKTEDIHRHELVFDNGGDTTTTI